MDVGIKSDRMYKKNEITRIDIHFLGFSKTEILLHHIGRGAGVTSFYLFIISFFFFSEQKYVKINFKPCMF